MRVLPRLFKLWPWIDLDLFYIKVKFGYIGFCMGESDFCFGNYCSLRSQSRLKHSAKWVNEVEWISKVKVILWTWPKVIQISKLNVWLWFIYSGERFRASWPSCLYRCPSLSCPLDRLPPGGQANHGQVAPRGQPVPGYPTPHPGYLHPRGATYPGWFILPPGGEDKPAGLSCPPPMILEQ